MMEGGDADEFAGLDAALDAGLAGLRASPGSVSLLFSGGVDSGLLAWELRGRRDLELLTIGAPGAADLDAARRGAELIGRPTRIVVLPEDEILEAQDRWSAVTVDLPPRRRSILLALALAVAHASNGTVVCGQGADELFLGYAHFRGLTPSQAAERSEADLSLLRTADFPRLDRIARALDRTVLAPYIDPRFVAAARTLPITCRLPHPIPKAVFRRWAMHRGLPEPIASRPKRALQYGSGVERAVRRADRRSSSPAGSSAPR